MFIREERERVDTYMYDKNVINEKIITELRREKLKVIKRWREIKSERFISDCMIVMMYISG